MTTDSTVRELTQQYSEIFRKAGDIVQREFDQLIAQADPTSEVPHLKHQQEQAKRAISSFGIDRRIAEGIAAALDPSRIESTTANFFELHGNLTSKQGDLEKAVEDSLTNYLEAAKNAYADHVRAHPAITDKEQLLKEFNNSQDAILAAIMEELRQEHLRQQAVILKKLEHQWEDYKVELKSKSKSGEITASTEGPQFPDTVTIKYNILPYIGCEITIKPFTDEKTGKSGTQASFNPWVPGAAERAIEELRVRGITEMELFLGTSYIVTDPFALSSKSPLFRTTYIKQVTLAELGLTGITKCKHSGDEILAAYKKNGKILDGKLYHAVREPNFMSKYSHPITVTDKAAIMNEDQINDLEKLRGACDAMIEIAKLEAQKKVTHNAGLEADVLRARRPIRGAT